MKTTLNLFTSFVMILNAFLKLLSSQLRFLNQQNELEFLTIQVYYYRLMTENTEWE